MKITAHGYQNVVSAIVHSFFTHIFYKIIHFFMHIKTRRGNIIYYWAIITGFIKAEARWGTVSVIQNHRKQIFIRS